MSTLSSCNSGSISGYVINALINATKNLESTCGSTTVTTPLTVEGLLTANDGLVVTGTLNVDSVSATTVTAVNGFTGQLLTASQPNITSVGTLSSLSCTGQFNLPGRVNCDSLNMTTSIPFKPLYSFPQSPPIMNLYLSTTFLIPRSAWTKIPYNAIVLLTDNGTVYNSSSGSFVNSNLGLTYFSANNTFYNYSGETRYLKIITQSLFSFNAAAKEIGTRVTLYSSNGQPRYRAAENVVTKTSSTYGVVISGECAFPVFANEPFTVDVYTNHDTGDLSLGSVPSEKTYTTVTIFSM